MAWRPRQNGSKTFISCNDLVTPEKIKEVARQVLDETEELKKERLHQLKTLINEHSLTCITRDDFLLRFLRTKKFDIERSFQTLKNYAQQRVGFHKRLLELQPEIVEKCLLHNIVGLLPYRDAEERLIIFFATGIWNTDICSNKEVGMVIALLLHYTIEKESSQTIGMVSIVNTKLLPLGQIHYLVQNAKFLFNFGLNCLPARYVRLHFINEPTAFKYAFQLISPFIPKKIKERMLFHGDQREELFQHFDPSILPEEYGGTLGPSNNDHLTKRLTDYLQKMKDEQRCFLGSDVRDISEEQCSGTQ